MTYPDDDDTFNVVDYEEMDRIYWHGRATGRWTQGELGNIFGHPLADRLQAEGWSDHAYPDLGLFKQQGAIGYGIQPAFMFEGISHRENPGWIVVVDGDGYYWKKFDTLGEALDAVRDRNFRGFEPVYPDPSNDIDSDYEMIRYGFSVARGEETGSSEFPPFNQ